MIGAVRANLDMSHATDGPPFRPVNRDGQVGETRLSDRAGLDPVRYAGHLLRRAGDRAGL